MDGLSITLRRLTQDEQFVERIFVGDDYGRDGFEIRASDTVIDIGGNIGAFALRAARSASAGRVFTYEPQAENFALLQKNIARNRFTNITASRTAIGGRAGTVRLFTGGDTGLHSTSPERGIDEAEYEEVPCGTLEQVFEQNQIRRCDFLKIDCEGAEYEILHNTPADVFARIDKIAMEYHSSDPGQKRPLSDGLVKLLQNHGFQIVDYIDFADYDCGFIRAKRNG